jgi:predicted TPR repeat methyltransferase
MKLARTAASIHPEAPFAQLVIGSVEHNRGHTREAMRAYQRFLEVCPDCRFAREVRLIVQKNR